MNQCYFNGEFYQCVTATNAGESPATNPEKWRRIQIPAAFYWPLTQLAYAQLLDDDGQADKAAAQRGKALGSERVGLDDTVRRAVNAERSRLERPGVQTPYNTNLNGLTGQPAWKL